MRVLAVVLRFIGSVALVSSLLLLADATVTLVWQEPITALLAQRQQDHLASVLSRETAAFDAARRLPARSRDLTDRMGLLAARERAHLKLGDPIGRITFPTLQRTYVIVEGTDTERLREGPGHYPGTPLPGEPGTVGVAGHRTTYLAPFRPIDQLRPGAPVVVSMPYGRFTYRVQHTRIVGPTAVWITNPVSYQRLVLSSCYPLYSASQRIVVFAQLASARTT